MGLLKHRAALLVGLALAGLTALAGAPASATTSAQPSATTGTETRLDRPAHPGYERMPASYRAPRRLDRVMARVETAEPWASVAGSLITEYYVDERRRVVSVGVARVTPTLRRAARRTFGTAVRLHQTDRYHRTSRTDDPAPHTAGAVIDTELGRCTSGFGVRRAGSTYFLGTAHCFEEVGETVTNHGEPYGRVVERELTERGPDAALVQSDFSPRMYVGGPNSDTARTVDGARTPPRGAQICTSGASTGQTCSGVRQQADICVRFGDGMTTCHLTRVVSTDGTSLVRPGDSGGPVYAGETYAVGMTVGGNEDGTALLYHPIGYLLDLWDAQLLTAAAMNGPPAH